MESVRSYSPTGISLPRVLGGWLLHWLFRGLLGVYCTLRPADSPSRLRRPSTSEASAASLPPPLLRLLPGGANQFPGRDFQPAVDQRLFTAHQHALAKLGALTFGAAVILAGLSLFYYNVGASRPSQDPLAA